MRIQKNSRFLCVRIFIAKGRIGDDINVGEFTCVKGANNHVIDYCVASHELLSMFSNFKVIDFDQLYSDVHCRIVQLK